MSQGGQGRATIHDIARLVGVSASTVSRAITGGTVSPATRALVLEAAERVGYRPNREARGLVSGRTGTLGLVLPDLRNPFFADIAKGVAARARTLGMQVFVLDTDEDAHAEAGAIDSLVGGVDVVLLCSPRSEDDELHALLRGQPAVVLHRVVDGLPSVTADIADGTHQALLHLRALGHRGVAYVAGPGGSWAGAQREAAVADGAAGIQVYGIGAAEPTFDGGFAIADRVLASGASAVLAYNDLVALGILQRLTTRGLRVPEDLSIVGYDDVPASTMVSPALTTVRTPQAAAGAAAVELARVAATRNGADNARQRVLPTSLVVRASTGVPAPRPSGPV